MRGVIREILHAFGIKKITECSDGSEAIGELHNKVIDFVIVDWVMEPMDGIEFIRLMRTADDSPNPFIPIIMLTGHTERHRIVQARDAGATEFLAKPVTPNGMFARIRALIENPRPFVRVGNFFGPCRRRKVEDFAGTSRREADHQADNEADTPNEQTASKSAEPTRAQKSGLKGAAAAVKSL